MGGISVYNTLPSNFPSITDTGTTVTISCADIYISAINTLTTNGTNNNQITGNKITFGSPASFISFFDTDTGSQQQAPATNPTGGFVVDTEARAAIDAIILQLKNLNITAQF